MRSARHFMYDSVHNYQGKLMTPGAPAVEIVQDRQWGAAVSWHTGISEARATPAPLPRVVSYGPIITSVRIWKTNGNSTEGVKVITGLGDKDLGAMKG